MSTSEALSLTGILQRMTSAGARRIVAKPLAANDNSKNQPYFGGDFTVLNVLPAKAPVAKTSGSHATPIFEAGLNLRWLAPDGEFYVAPRAKLILYPQYPEVRLSGYLRGCEYGPSELMGLTRTEGRLLLLGVCDDGRILGWAGAPDSAANQEFLARVAKGGFDRVGVFYIIPAEGEGKDADRAALLRELRRIHLSGWIDSKRLKRGGGTDPCLSRNCGGYTLEAELGILPNGYSEPDFRGWEVKQHAVKSFAGMASGPITLMTPEPTGGVYLEQGVIDFIRRYGYPDVLGRHDRRNFGGVHRAGEVCDKTGLTLSLVGYDTSAERITDSAGGLALVGPEGEYAAFWHFGGLMKHWNRKHASAVYVPSMIRRAPKQGYSFGTMERLGVGTDFLKFLQAVGKGLVYYDPGIKAESWSTKPEVKRRSQFRIKSKEIGVLYDALGTVSLL